MTSKMKTGTQPLFAALSDANGILEYAGRHSDLPDAVIAYADAVSMEIAEENQAEGITWLRFDTPPPGWEEWTGDMHPDEYDAMRDAPLEILHAHDAVPEALARWTSAKIKRLENEVANLKAQRATRFIEEALPYLLIHCVSTFPFPELKRSTSTD